jgi:replicative DNA helicase Mcm
MTAAAVPDEFGPSKWSLTAGLLVLANGGLACLDEIDKVEPDALNAAHSALENQRVSVSKAGIDADLPARTTLLAAGNPDQRRFDQFSPVSDQTNLPTSLMSRFDLMFILTDEPDADCDSEVAEHITRSWAKTSALAAGHEGEERNALNSIGDIDCLHCGCTSRD